MNSKDKYMLEILYESGTIALKYFNNKENKVNIKKDETEVTQADLEINEYLVKNIKRVFGNINFLSEEDSVSEQIKSVDNNEFFIIDPIDGTSSFIRGIKDFTINVSLVKNNILQFSAIYLPMYDLMYFADEENSYKITTKENFLDNNYIRLNKLSGTQKELLEVITTERKDEINEIKKYLSKSLKKYKYNNVSSSKKFCDLADGSSDIYIRKARIRLWDVAAGFHITNNVGLKILDMSRKNLYENFLSKDYIFRIKNNEFRVDEFIILPQDLELF